MCPWAPSSLRSYRLLHKALPAGETWARTMQKKTFCRPERAFSCRTVFYLRKGKEFWPCPGQATGWSLTYSEARSAVGPGAAGGADLPLLGPPLTLAAGPGRAKEAGRRTRPYCSLPDPRPHSFALGRAALGTGPSQGAATGLGGPPDPRSHRGRHRRRRRHGRGR